MCESLFSSLFFLFIHFTILQCDVYRKDFEIERKQREEMAQEREQMIADITMLKRRNQALVDEAQS